MPQLKQAHSKHIHPAAGQEDLDAGLSMTERLQRRDELLAHQQSSLEASDQKCRCLQQRIEDLFGAEAAELEPPKMQYTAKQGSCSLCTQHCSLTQPLQCQIIKQKSRLLEQLCMHPTGFRIAAAFAAAQLAEHLHHQPATCGLPYAGIGKLTAAAL